VTTGIGGGKDGGLSWVTETAGGTDAATTPPTGTSSTAGVDLDSGNDWLAAITSDDQTKQKPRVTASSAKATASPAAPGGWMSSKTVGIPTEVDSAQETASKAGAGTSAASTAASTKPRKWKQGRVLESAARRIGGWLSPRSLGVPTENEKVDDEEEVGGGDYQGVRVTIETQTDDDIGTVTEREGSEEGGGSKLPPWAKPWVPSPKQQVAPNPAPEATSAPNGGTKKKVM